jgi:eukaryotic-like serine/threonine-protein kinase
MLSDRTTAPLEPSDAPHVVVGPFHLLQKVGEGGMGEVFEAEQREPVHRRVALKLIKPGLASREVLARFELEREALARLNHPGIAQIYDAGYTSDGRPYFAMEYVAGVQLHAYCRTHGLTLRERIGLIISLCDAVQHAHQKGIIHRDLKPSNVLVTGEDGRWLPKIIDFGVAKSTQGRLVEQTMVTVIGQVIGTPMYMAPEQSSLAGLDIDTRVDVYALGVLLYELLTGVPPFDSERLDRMDLEELLRVMREEEPPSPSARLLSLSSREVDDVAAEFRMNPRTLAHAIRGDLDWITLRAMEKDRTRRYGSAADLAMDLNRYLQNEPVLASPPSTLYRVRKFVRRHRAGVAAATAVGLALVLGIVGTGIGLYREFQAEREARDEAETARQVISFLSDIFNVSDPSEARGNNITAREILDKGAVRIEGELNDRPLIKARILDTIAGVYRNLGLYKEALPLAREALSIRERERGPWDGDVASSLNRIGELLTLQYRYPEALPFNERAMGIRRKLGDLSSVDAAWSMYHLGSTLASMGRFAQGKSLLDSAIVAFRRAPGQNDLAVAWCLNELAIGEYTAGRIARAEPLLRQSVELKRKALGPDHPDVAAGLSNLGTVVSELGRPADAKALIEQALAITEKTAGPRHENNTAYLAALASTELQLTQYDSALVHFGRALAISEASRNIHALALSCRGIAEAYVKLGNPSLAERFYRRSIGYWEQDGGATATDRAEFLREYSAFLQGIGRSREADEIRVRASRS